jgi:hypothetical protein
VDFGTSLNYGSSSTLNSTLVTSHSVALSGLTASTLYYFRVRSKDSNGVEVDSGSATFNTSSATNPGAGPQIGSVSAAVTTTTATITWNTNVPATDQVFYGTATSYGQSSAKGTTLVTAHSVALSGLGSGTIYYFQVQSADSSGNVSTSANSSFQTTASGQTAANSWANRRAGVNTPGGAASIVSSQDFEATLTHTCTAPCSSYAPGAQSYAQYYFNDTPATDCTVSVDGSCSLKFTIRQGMLQGDPGWFDYNFKPDLSATFGAGQEFFVQYRMRIDPALLGAGAVTPDEGMKHDIITEGDTLGKSAGDCSNSPGEVVTITDANSAFSGPILYNNCGFSGGTAAFMQSGYQPIQLGGIANSNFLDQPSAGCPHYGGRGIPTSDPTCFIYVGNEWMTLQMHIKVGAFGAPTSVIEMWAGHQGQPARLAVNASDAAIVNDGSGGASGKYGKIQLTPYDTNSTFNVNSAVWYDDLIVATRRIPDPDVPTPNAPDSLSVSNISATSVTVNWRVNSQNGTAQDDTGFLIERCTGAGTACFPSPQSGFTQIGTTAAGAASYTDNSVVSGQTYTYRVRAKNGSGDSAYTAAQCFNGGATCGDTVAVP